MCIGLRWIVCSKTSPVVSVFEKQCTHQRAKEQVEEGREGASTLGGPRHTKLTAIQTNHYDLFLIHLICILILFMHLKHYYNLITYHFLYYI